MVNEMPLVKLDYNMYTGPSADCVWSMDNKCFFSTEQLINQMRETDTLGNHVPDFFNEVQRATNVSCRDPCDDLRPIMNAPGFFTLDEHTKLGPQLFEFNDKANAEA